MTEAILVKYIIYTLYYLLFDIFILGVAPLKPITHSNLIQYIIRSELSLASVIYIIYILHPKFYEKKLFCKLK